MSTRIIAARTASEREQVYELRHEVFEVEEKRLNLGQERILDRFDTFEETINLLAVENGKPIATMRLMLENPEGFPATELFDFGPLLKTLSGKGKVACVGWFCVKKDYRHHPGLVIGFFKYVIRKMRQTGHRHVIATVHPPVLALLTALSGAEAAGPVVMSKELGVEFVPMYCDLDRIPTGARENFEEPLELLLGDSDERRIYKKGEIITAKGDEAKEAFFIMRGAVRIAHESPAYSELDIVLGAPVPNEAPRDLIFGQGEIFGELAMLNEGVRSATVVAHSKEVDLMVVPKDRFLEGLANNNNKAMALCRILASRLQRNIKGTMYNPSKVLLARVILEASRGGQLKVNSAWLMRTCAYLEDLGEVVDEWVRAGWLGLEETEIKVIQPAMLEHTVIA